MIVWLVKAGEPTPLDPGAPRLLRTGHLARYLAGRGHTVVWWTAAFDHHRKTFRQADEAIARGLAYEIVLVNSPGYSRNVSVRRWLDDVALAWSIYRGMRRAPNRPDVIVCAYPLIFVALAVVIFKLRHGGRLLLDVRDMWPDIFASATAGWRSRIYALFAAVHRPIVHVIFSTADGITGITDPFLDWALRLAGRARSPRDGVFPLTSSPAEISVDQRAAAGEFFSAHGVSADTINFCFFGTFSGNVDLRTVIEAGRLLQAQQDEPHRPDIRVVLCGSGDYFDAVTEMARGIGTVVCPGWIDGSKMTALMEISAAGLAPYRNRPDFLASVPNKVIEYFSRGLPVIAGIDGLVGNLIEAHGCGLKYQEGDAAALAGAMMRLARDSDLRQLMSRRARSLYDDQYAADVVYDRFARHVELAGAGA